MTLDEAIETYTNNAEYERREGNLLGCLEFKQLAEWLTELKVYKSGTPSDIVETAKAKSYVDCQQCKYHRNPSYTRCKKCEETNGGEYEKRNQDSR